MKKITIFTEEIKEKTLELLYEDELFNVFMIHFIENQSEDIGELFVLEEDNRLLAILHLKFDGNSYFTSFYSKTDKGLEEIAKQVKKLKYDRVLLAGKMKDVEGIINYLERDQRVTPNVYYKYHVNHDESEDLSRGASFRRAIKNPRDISKIKKFLIEFFDARSKEDIDSITNEEKILEDFKSGIYVVEKDEEIVGMARFYGETREYIDITTVYIDYEYRGQGLGKELMKNMVMEGLRQGKIPVTQTSTDNKAAMRTYESLGFIKQDDYAFEFIS